MYANVRIKVRMASAAMQGSMIDSHNKGETVLVSKDAPGRKSPRKSWRNRGFAKGQKDADRSSSCRIPGGPFLVRHFIHWGGVVLRKRQNWTT